MRSTSTTRKYVSSDSAETSIIYIALIGALITTVALPFDYRLPTSVLDYGLFTLIGFADWHFLVIKAFRLGEVPCYHRSITGSY